MQIKKILSTINQLFSQICGFLLISLTLLLVADFIGRFLSVPIQGLNTFSTFILIAVVYLGLPLCEEEKNHVKVDLLTSRLPNKPKRILKLLSYWVALVISFICVWTSGFEAINAFITKQKTPGTILFLTYPVKFVLVIGLIFYFFQIFINTIEEYKK